MDQARDRHGLKQKARCVENAWSSNKPQRLIAASDEIKELQREIAELEAKLAAKGSEQSDIRSATISAPPEAAKAPLAPGAAPSPAAPGRPPAFSKALHGVRGCCYDLD
ncbi:unnamed protein product [Prorocentrum cordatum]|uniref:Uncharacterized protein n=1 Tax=Prorocentrum cordatum TaxID=2364126 RepID=A0ABN9VFH5_9DINO|nr:unnamed protein product [Polarella glacialis]